MPDTFLYYAQLWTYSIPQDYIPGLSNGKIEEQ